MPLYDYKCPAGHLLTKRVKMDGSDAPTECPELTRIDETPEDKAGVWGVCGLALQRVLTAPASIFPGAASWRHGK